MIIAAVGHTRQIAEIGALGRLGQLFTAFAAVNAAVVVPYLSRSPPTRLGRSVWLVLSATAALGTTISLTAFLAPTPFLWLLGSHYESLAADVGWAVLAGALGLVGTVLYSINLSRQFIGWGKTNLALAFVVAMQIVSAGIFDLTTTLGVQQFLVTTAGSIAVGNAAILWQALRSAQPQP